MPTRYQYDGCVSLCFIKGDPESPLLEFKENFEIHSRVSFHFFVASSHFTRTSATLLQLHSFFTSNPSTLSTHNFVLQLTMCPPVVWWHKFEYFGCLGLEFCSFFCSSSDWRYQFQLSAFARLSFLFQSCRNPSLSERRSPCCNGQQICQWEDRLAWQIHWMRQQILILARQCRWAYLSSTGRKVHEDK